MAKERQEEVYFAAPLFCDDEKRGNLNLVHRIEGIGYTVFLPQRDGYEFARMKALLPEERNRKIFRLDHEKVTGAKILTARLDGRVPDEGVCVEVALAYKHKIDFGQQKLILGLKTDTRFLLQEAEVNPMILGCLNRLFKSEDELIDFLRRNYHYTH